MPQWKILPKQSDDLLEQLLINRGIKTEKEKHEFFNPIIENYNKDLKIPGILAAQKRIEKAIEKKEQIIVYGDYDVDGICASAILYKSLTSLGAKVLPYIPHREKEGYGLSKIGLEFARDSGATLVITVDNGIVAIEQAKFAKEIGLDLIITDHHMPLEVLPEALVIVHSTGMCGAGVAWCLIREMVSKTLADDLLEFVAVATICDMIPLLGVDRAFVYEGLKQLNKTKTLGFKELIRESGLNFGEIGSYEIGHILGPRLNAIGRLEHAIDALRLVCTSDPIKARNLAKLLGDANSKRQQLTTQAVDEARILVQKNGTVKIHVLDSKSWAPGIIGLIAARICEENYKPAIAISVGETVSKGSARSIDGVNIIELIRKHTSLLVDVGGHKGAAGFSIANENIEAFRKKLEEAMEKEAQKVGEKVLEIEAEITGRDLTKKTVKELENLEPCGLANPKPLFVSKQMKISDIRTLSEGKHLKFKSDGIDCIAFGMGQMADQLKDGQLVDLAFFLEINKFNGNENLQLKIRDIKID